MARQFSGRYAARGFTLSDLTVLTGAVALLALMLSTTLPAIRIEDRRKQCAANLHRISQGLAACYAENNDYGPTWDDGGIVSNMLNWPDVLYDLDYVADDNLRICPDDEHPDEVTELRAGSWGFVFDDDFEDSEPPIPGVRTSYALNSHMHYNFKEDRFEDPSRQVFVIDGWWSWFGCLNAAWLMAGVAFDYHTDPLGFPNWQGTMVAWRHGANYAANALYRDGHVWPIIPMVPEDPQGVYTDTVDTLQSFTWLPGERDVRFDYDRYRGEIEDYYGWRPYWTDPDEYKHIDSSGQRYPVDYPEFLSCYWRTENEAWIKFPNDRE